MSIRKAARILALAVLAGVFFAVQAEAIPIISISPVSQNKVVTDPVSVDIVVSGLGALEEVGAFNLILSFNSLVLAPTGGLGVGFIPDPAGKMGLGLDVSAGFSAGKLDLTYLAEDFGIPGPDAADQTALRALQGGGFVLARVNFTAIADGFSPLVLSVVGPAGTFLSTGLGFVLPATSQNGSVCVGDPNQPACQQVSAVPEPGTVALLGTGICALFVRYRRQARRTV